MHGRLNPDITVVPLGLETEGGGPDVAAPAEVASFLAAQGARLRDYAAVPRARLRRSWNEAVAQAGENLEQLVHNLLDQLSTAVNETSVIETQTLLNEISRRPEGTEAVRRQLTKEKLLSFVARGR